MVLGIALALPLSAQVPIDPGWPPFPVGQEVTFVNTSERGETFEWDFEYDFQFVSVDSTAEDGVWTYQEPGEYAVRLEVCNPFGCDVVIKRIQVTEPSLPDLLFSSGFETGDASEWSGSVQ